MLHIHDETQMMMYLIKSVAPIWHSDVSMILLNSSLGSGFMPDNTKPLAGPVLTTDHQYEFSKYISLFSVEVFSATVIWFYYILLSHYILLITFPKTNGFIDPYIVKLIVVLYFHSQVSMGIRYVNVS